MPALKHKSQPKMAVINDMSGFGRCSLTVSLPIISRMKVQCCPVPTSIFSNHTAFPSYYFCDFTDHMESYINEWKKLKLNFSGILTGFLGSAEQIEIVKDFLEHFKNRDCVAIIDPIMGDHGKAYKTYTPEMCEKMAQLVPYADILTPNLTEACILTGTEYKEKWKVAEIAALAAKLSAMGPDKVVITGIQQGSLLANLCYEKGKKPEVIKTVKVGTQRCGTGDVFASIIAADAVNGVPFDESVKKAAQFIKKCIKKSIELEIPVTDGVCFEEVLASLK